jgi:exopolyphosphatase/guanosine-5'-triphosphate,3'-diphosphate pyrophosphatase
MSPLNRDYHQIMAIVDIGTNTVKMTAARASGDALEILDKETYTTRLGAGMSPDGKLDTARVGATAEAVARLVARARAAGAAEVRIVGTSALRDGTDGCSTIERATGLRVDVISGSREASLSYLAARTDPQIRGFVQGQRCCVIDIGGGSVEYAWGDGDQADTVCSKQIGAVRLTGAYLSKSDPPDVSAVREAEEFVVDAISGLLPLKESVTATGICVGGTAMTMLGMARANDMANGAWLSGQTVRTVLQTLATADNATRRNMMPREPERADIIVGGAIALAASILTFGMQGVYVSNRGLRYGLLLEMLQNSDQCSVFLASNRS